MRTRIKPRLTYANAMSTIAVFGVLAGGGAYAASKIGPNDIKPNAVRSKHIKKKAVKTPKIANRAVTAAKLADGPPFPDTLPSGTTVRGVFLAEGQATDPGAFIGDSISFGFTFASKPTVHFISVGDPVPAGCSGTAADPGAAPGHVCAFEVENTNVNDAQSAVWSPPANSSNDSATFGAGVFSTSAAAGNYEFGGSWAATSP
jgi:hypothetical protein